MTKTELLNKFAKDPEERVELARALDQMDRAANRIIVVDENHILEEGTHEELLAKGGEYAQLYNAQKRAV